MVEYVILQMQMGMHALIARAQFMVDRVDSAIIIWIGVAFVGLWLLFSMGRKPGT